jgi:nuclear GTP-binding protein
MDNALGLKALWSHLDDLANKKKSGELVVAVTGVTNTGKSAVINSLLGADALPIYSTYAAASIKGPYTTTLAQEVVAAIPGNDTTKVRFIDTPGLQYVRPELSGEAEKEEMRARDILLRCRGRIDRLKDPLFAVSHILSRADTQDLMLGYNLPAFAPGDPTAFLAGLARVSGCVKKRGVLDHAGAARIVLRDWSTGEFARYTVPQGTCTSVIAERGDEDVLATLRSRKEMRRAGAKLVKLQAGEVEKRDVDWDVAWEEEEEEEEGGSGAEGEDGDEDQDEEDGDEAVDEVDGDGQSECGDGDGDDRDDTEEEEAPELLTPPPTKRKRTVSFAAPTSDGKRRRGHVSVSSRKGGR